MPRRFLPTLATKPHPAQASSELKVVLADYYNALSSAGIYPGYRTRPWPVERAVAEAYERIVWVFKATEAIAGHASRLPVRLKNGDTVLEDHPLYAVLNKKANPLETARQFRKRLSAQVLLSKRGAFVEVTRSRGGDVARLDLLPPGRTRPVPGFGDVLVDHYEVLRQDGTRTEVPAENVRWFREPHPLDPYCGVTPLEAAGLSVELDFFTRLYNVSFMRNDGRPGGVLAVDGEMDPGEMDRIEDRFGKGPAEAGKLTVINGKVSYVDVAARPRDMQHQETSRTSKIEILAAFGVPESVLGYASEKTFANADAELYNFWTITMPPHLDLLASGFDEDSADDLETFLDTEDVEVLQRTKVARREEARAEFAAGLISPDEYREEAGYGPVGTARTRALYISNALVPVPTSDADAKTIQEQDAAAAPAPPPPTQHIILPPGAQPPPGAPGNGGAPSDPKTPAGGAQRQPQAAPAVAGPKQQPALPAAKVLRMVPGARPAVRARSTKTAPAGETVSEPDDRAYDKLQMALAAALTALAVRLTQRALARAGSPKARKGTRHWVSQYERDTRTGTKALDASNAVDERTWQAEAETTAHPILDAAAVAAAAALLADLAPDAPIPPAGAVAGVTAAIVKLIGESAAAQARRLAALINTADQAGRSVEEIGVLVRQHGEQMAGWADGVATTAATATMAAARDAAAQALADASPGIDINRQWITRLDGKVRDTHKAAHGQSQPLGEPFAVGAALLMEPGDPHGPPGETINCRCKLNHRAVRSGRFVAKPAELAATGTGGASEGKDAVGGHHVPGTPQHWRHEWRPLDADTARRYRKPFEQGADHLTGSRGTSGGGLEEGMASGRLGVPETLASGTQGTVFLVRFKNGTKAVQKIFADSGGLSSTPEEQIHAEELATKLERALGLDAPEAIGDRGSIVMAFKEGDTLAALRANESDKAKKEEISSKAISSRDGRLIGLLDLAMGNVDRNSANVIVNGDRLSPIDHGWAFRSTYDDLMKFGGNPFIDGISKLGIKNYSKSDIEHIKGTLERLRPEFASRGREDWYETAMNNLARMSRLARGKGSLF